MKVDTIGEYHNRNIQESRTTVNTIREYYNHQIRDIEDQRDMEIMNLPAFNIKSKMWGLDEFTFTDNGRKYLEIHACDEKDAVTEFLRQHSHLQQKQFEYFIAIKAGE